MNFYNLCLDFFKDYEEVTAAAFYREIFPNGELQAQGEEHNWKYNAIACEIDKAKPTKRFTIKDDLIKIDELLQSDKFIIVAPISYVGKARTAKNARYLYALAFDLDGVDEIGNLTDLFFQMQNDVLPYPTYVASTGNGLHLYYQFEFPVPLFSNIAEQLGKLKYELTERIWNKYTTSLYKATQHQPIYQGYRMVGGVTKDYAETGHRVKVWRINNHPTTIEELNKFVTDENKVKDIQYKPMLSLEQAKQKYPDWYERRIIKKEKRGKWSVSVNVYEWWYKRIQEEFKEGHRYYCIMTLAVYAQKCGVSQTKLKTDAYALFDLYESKTTREENHFTKDDIRSALKAYKNPDLYTLPINSISHFSGIRIEKNKRNGRKKDVHQKLMTNQLKMLIQLGEVKNGRKSAEPIVFQFLENNPTATVKEFCEETGMSRRVFFKYKKLKLDSLS